MPPCLLDSCIWPATSSLARWCPCSFSLLPACDPGGLSKVPCNRSQGASQSDSKTPLPRQGHPRMRIRVFIFNVLTYYIRPFEVHVSNRPNCVDALTLSRPKGKIIHARARVPTLISLTVTHKTLPHGSSFEVYPLNIFPQAHIMTTETRERVISASPGGTPFPQGNDPAQARAKRVPTDNETVIQECVERVIGALRAQSEPEATNLKADR